MTFKFSNVGKTFTVNNNNEVTVTHNHDALISVAGEYFKNKLTNEWVSEQEAESIMCKQHENDSQNLYY